MKEGLDSRPDPSERKLVPIPRNEANQYLHDLVYGDIDFGSDAAIRRIFTQEEGLSALNKFLLRQADFDSLGIFRLDFDGGKYRRSSGQYQIYLGKLEEGTKNPYYLSISPAHYLGHEPEHLFVVPRTLQVGHSPYYWIEFTEEIKEESMRPAFLSYRLRPDQPNTKVDSKYWRGLEEQLLVDFIQGENGITISDLTPFRAQLNPKGHPYSLGAVQDLKLNLTGNSQIEGGDKLLIIPNTDAQNIYYWIDILKEVEVGQEPMKVSAYRILRDEKKLSGLGWRNPETQYLVDYLSGNPQITFANLRPLRVRLRERFNQISVGQGTDKYFQISIGNSTELGIEEVILVPQQDSKGLYQWVEAYKFDPETGKPVGEAIASARMIQGVGFERTGWFGAGRQSLIDYSNGEKSFDDLLTITLEVGANTKMLDVWGVQKEHVWLTLSVKSGLKSGDQVELIPTEEANGVVTYTMMHGQVELGSYSFDRQTKKFGVIELYDVREIIPQPRDYLVDYSQGRKGFAELQAIPLKAKKNPSMIDILSRGEIHIYITPAKSFGLVPGDEAELVPEGENEGQAIFSFVKDGNVLGHYRYDTQTMKFRLHEITRPTVNESKDTTEADNYLRNLVYGEDEK